MGSDYYFSNLKLIDFGSATEENKVSRKFSGFF